MKRGSLPLSSSRRRRRHQSSFCALTLSSRASSVMLRPSRTASERTCLACSSVQCRFVALFMPPACPTTRPAYHPGFVGRIRCHGLMHTGRPPSTRRLAPFLSSRSIPRQARFRIGSRDRTPTRRAAPYEPLLAAGRGPHLHGDLLVALVCPPWCRRSGAGPW
jgi:hypothetical protein